MIQRTMRIKDVKHVVGRIILVQPRTDDDDRSHETKLVEPV